MNKSFLIFDKKTIIHVFNKTFNFFNFALKLKSKTFTQYIRDLKHLIGEKKSSDTKAGSGTEIPLSPVTLTPSAWEHQFYSFFPEYQFYNLLRNKQYCLKQIYRENVRCKWDLHQP